MTALPPLVVAPPSDDPLLTRKDLAARWQCSLSGIEKRPANELPPTCSVLPGQRRYRLSDILRFEASRLDQSTHNLGKSASGRHGSQPGRVPQPRLPDSPTGDRQKQSGADQACSRFQPPEGPGRLIGQTAIQALFPD